MSIRMRKCLLIAAIALCACPKRSPGQGADDQPRVEVKPSAEADRAYNEAQQTAGKGNRKEGIEALLSVRQRFPETTAGEDALYEAGILSYEEGDYAGARKALSELLFENPLYVKANDARLHSGLAALELKAYRDAYQTLSTLCEKLEGA